MTNETPQSSRLYKSWFRIYVLTDMDGKVFYVGMTTQNLEKRFFEHLNEIRHLKGKRVNWVTDRISKIRKICELDFKIQIQAIEILWLTSDTSNGLRNKGIERENYWIKKMAERGHQLTNYNLKRVLNPKVYYPDFVGRTLTAEEVLP